MKTAKPEKSVTQIVTLTIIGLCVIFVGFIIFSYIQKKRAAAPGLVSAGGQPGGMQPGQASSGSPGAGAQTTRSGNQAAGQAAGGNQGAGNAPGQSPRSVDQAGGQAPGGSQSGGGQTPRSGSQAGGSNQGAASQAAGGSRTVPRGTAVRVSPIKLDTIENRVIINGDVLARTQVSIYPTVGGKLAEARLKVGDSVRQGQTIAMVDPSRPGEVYSNSPVVSPVSGIILSAPVNLGDTLSVQTAVYVVGDLSSLLVETFIPERFATVARKGLAAKVSLEAIPGETFETVVDEVSPVLDPASRTLKIRLRFTKPDPRIRAGMFATVTLVTNAKHDVPVIPRSAVINTYGSWIVFTVTKGNTAERREIKLGLESEDLIEVVSGLELGEQVVTVGQNFLSNGDPVRIVEG